MISLSALTGRMIAQTLATENSSKVLALSLLASPINSTNEQNHHINGHGDFRRAKY